MAIGKGSKSKIIWLPEVTYKVPPSASDYRGLLFSNEGIVENINSVASEDIRSDRTRAAIRGGNIVAGGPFTHDYGIIRSAMFMKHLLACSIATTNPTAVAITGGGAVTRGEVYWAAGNSRLYLVTRGGTFTDTAANLNTALLNTAIGDYVELGGCKFQVMGTSAATYYIHTFTSGINYPTGGLSFEKQILGGTQSLYVLYRGGRMNSLELAIPQEGIVKANWGYLAIDSVSTVGATNISGLGTIVYPTDEPVSGFESFITFNNGQLVRPIREGSLNITNNVDESVFCVGERVRRELPEGERTITGRVTMYFEDSTEYNYFKNEEKVAVRYSFNNHGNFAEFEIPEVKLTGSGTPQIGGAGVVTASYDMSAFLQTGSFDAKLVIKSTSAAAAL